MTVMTIHDIDKWIAQNDAFILDAVEGCLLDNMYIACRRGIAFVLETYVNANSSVYTCYFFRRGECNMPEYNRLAEYWAELERAAYAEMTA